MKCVIKQSEVQREDASSVVEKLVGLDWQRIPCYVRELYMVFLKERDVLLRASEFNCFLFIKSLSILLIGDV